MDNEEHCSLKCRVIVPWFSSRYFFALQNLLPPSRSFRCNRGGRDYGGGSLIGDSAVIGAIWRGGSLEQFATPSEPTSTSQQSILRHRQKAVVSRVAHYVRLTS